jgi:hypothetical protein
MNVVIFTNTIAPILISVKVYIGLSLRYFFIRNLVEIAPNTEPNGKTPINMDWVVKGSIVMWYSKTIFLMGTDVISLRLYPNMIALNDRISPINIVLVLFFSLFFVSKKPEPASGASFVLAMPCAFG